MKIVDRKEFLSMEGNVLFCKLYDHHNFGELCVKVESTDYGDFACDELWCVRCDGDCMEIVDKIEEASKNHEKVVEIDCKFTGRDGLFDEDQKFAVFSKDDVKQIIERLEKCL